MKIISKALVASIQNVSVCSPHMDWGGGPKYGFRRGCLHRRSTVVYALCSTASMVERLNGRWEVGNQSFLHSAGIICVQNCRPQIFVHPRQPLNLMVSSLSFLLIWLIQCWRFWWYSLHRPTLRLSGHTMKTHCYMQIWRCHSVKQPCGVCPLFLPEFQQSSAGRHLQLDRCIKIYHWQYWFHRDPEWYSVDIQKRQPRLMRISTGVLEFRRSSSDLSHCLAFVFSRGRSCGGRWWKLIDSRHWLSSHKRF